MDVRRKSTGQILILNNTDKIGAGGEAGVFAVSGSANLVAKIYHRPETQHARKIEAMLSSAPKNLNNVSSRIAIAWPVDLLLAARGNQNFVGFLMPRIAAQRSIIEVYNPLSRKRLDPSFNYSCLLRAAGNLAAAVSALHQDYCVIGDLNETNTWVGRDSRITLIDCDSFQVRDARTGETFRCNVGKAEYTPPELQGERFSEVYREREHDLFGLAVLIFQLLMEGTNPFAGVPLNSDEESVIGDRIARGHFPYGTKYAPYRPPPFAPPFSALHPSLQTLFLQCFETGYERPNKRPSALVWEDTIHKAEVLLKTCARNRNHVYCDHLISCPWCERTQRLGGLDPFPSKRPITPKKAIAPPPPKFTKPASNPVTLAPPPAPATSSRDWKSSAGGCLFWIIVIFVWNSVQKACSPQHGTVVPRAAIPTPFYEPSPAVTQRPNATPYQATLFTYRARLSEEDHFDSDGHDLRLLRNTTPNDILLRNRIRYHTSHQSNPENQWDPDYVQMDARTYERLFLDRQVYVEPNYLRDVIIRGTPLVEVTVYTDRILVKVLEAPNAAPTPLPFSTPATPFPSITPNPARQFDKLKWPDGRMLTHPEHYVQTGVINVRRDDTLKLRMGPGTKFPPVADIPADETGILAFDQDQVWDGDTWWGPVEWHGFLGYVSRRYLP
jgi:hypothetical protein